MPNIEHFHQDASSLTLIANVFQPDYSEREFSCALSDVGHLGLYTYDCVTMVAGDLVQIYDSSITKYIGAYKYEPNTVSTVAQIADAVWDEAVSGHTTSTTFGGKNQVVVPSTLETQVQDIQVMVSNNSDEIDALTTLVNAIPTNTEFNARTLPSADYVVVGDTIAGCTLVGTCTTNTDLAAVKTETDKIASLVTAVITNATGADIATDIVALKAETVSILADTAEIQGKLPTNKIMGSSDVDNHDTDIDSILADTNELQVDDTPATLALIKTETDKIASIVTATITNADGTDIAADIIAIKADTANILTDTGTTLDTLIKDIPTTAEFESRTLPSADYVVVGDTIARVTLVDTCTTNTDIPAVKAKTDQLEFTAGTVNANIATGGLGTGSEQVDYYVFTNETSETGAIANVSVYVSSDEAGTVIVASGMTDSNGKVTFYLNTGTYYMWRSKAGYSFTNPDTEVVS
jgi:hypothetical protein